MKKSDLEKQGWIKQTTYDDSRLNDIIEMYDEIGFEVTIAPFEPGEESGCSACMMCQPGRYKTIYTRKRTPHEDRH